MKFSSQGVEFDVETHHITKFEDSALAAMVSGRHFNDQTGDNRIILDNREPENLLLMFKYLADNN